MFHYPLNTRRTFLSIAAASLAAASLPMSCGAAAPATNVGRQAPQWDILEWINSDGGNIDTLRGKVIIVDFFQLWCPGCNKFSGPLMKRWQSKLADEINAGRLVLVKIHTVFEGHSYQTVQRLKSYVKENEITMPVGVDRHIGNRRIPETMRRYNTRGTPEMAVIDTDGVIRFQKFGFFDPAAVEPMIVALLAQARA